MKPDFRKQLTEHFQSPQVQAVVDKIYGDEDTVSLDKVALEHLVVNLTAGILEMMVVESDDST